MNELNREAVERLTASAGLGAMREMVPLAGGANNRVFRVEAENGEAVLKAYFRHPCDPRDRLAAEFGFARFAWAAGVRCIPQPLACDPEHGLGLFEFVDGKPVAQVGEESVEQGIAFVGELNAARWRPLASRLPTASEACFSIAEHLGTVARRVTQLDDVSDPDAREFVIQELRPAWDLVRRVAVDDACDNGLSLARQIALSERCVSPSDFGFHNALREVDGRVRFIDFEYAGWDDPAKLICDFFCQPAVQVPLRYFDRFADAVAACFPNSEMVVARARLLLPVYRMKWVCIRLNEFLPTAERRRAYSLADDVLAKRKQQQLAAARAALTALRDSQEVAT